MKKTDLAYFAGILDGEGTITLIKTQIQSPKQKQTYRVLVQVVNTSEWLIQQLRFSFGGAVCSHRRISNIWKDSFRWRITGDTAGRFLKITLPYIKLKRPQAELALQFLLHKKKGGRKTQEYIDFEKDYKENFLQLNHRGK